MEEQTKKPAPEIDPITKKFVKGNIGGPGRTLGSTNFITKWEALVKKLAKQENIHIDQKEQELLLVAYEKAKEGDYSFWNDIHDRLYGKPVQSVDMEARVTSKAELTDEQLDRIVRQRAEELAG